MFCNIEPQPFDIAGEFKNGLAEVETYDGKGYINKAGKIVWKPTN